MASEYADSAPYKNDESIIGLLSDLGKLYPDAEVIRISENGDLISYKAEKLVHDVTCVGNVFVSMGLCGKTVAVVGNNSYNWIVTYLAAICSGAVAMPVDHTLSSSALAQQLTLAGTALVVCDSDSLRKINERAFEYVAMLDGRTTFTVKDSIEEFITTGEGLIADGYRQYADMKHHNSAPAQISFESGVYGRDKAVCLSGRGLYTQIVNSSDVSLGKKLFITERLSSVRTLCSALSQIFLGYTVSWSDNENDIFRSAAESGADSVLLTPLGARKYYERIWAQAASGGFAHELEKRIKRAVFFSKFGISARKSVYSFLRRSGCNCVNRLIVFGNNIDGETAFGLHMSGIDVLCEYFVPECGVISYNVRSDGKNETLGRPVQDLYVRINELSQILVKSDSAMTGYLGEGVYPEHWIPTGDTGFFSDGRIVLQNDPAQVFITESAGRVYPQKLEELVKKQIPYASSADITADERGISLRVTFDRDFLSITGRSDIKNIVETSVRGVNKSLRDYEQITYICVEEN